MSEEEKKAIEYLKNRLEILHNNTQWSTEESIKIVLNLIHKQQKEIEDLRIIADDIKGHNIIYTDTPEFEDRFISNDKLREILNKYAKTDVKNHVEILNFYRELKELLGE